MGDWPLLTDEQRMAGVERWSNAGVPVIVGTGAQNTARAAALAAHAKRCGAKGLMIIPRVLSRGSSAAAQRAHFAGVLEAGGRSAVRHLQQPLLWLRDPGRTVLRTARRAIPISSASRNSAARQSLSYAAEHIAGRGARVALMVGVDTQVFHGFVNCGASGAITGIGNVLPREVLHLVALCQRAANGDARRAAARWNSTARSRRSRASTRAPISCSTTNI